MSISATLSSIEWQGRKINLLDTPGEPSFVADALGALRVCESAVFVVNAVMGVEVTTSRLWARAAELDIARMLFVNMLDRERADFFRTLEQLKGAFGAARGRDRDPDRLRARAGGRDRPGRHEGLPRRTPPAPRARASSEIPIPEAEAERAQEYREKLMDEVCEVSDSLMERYLEGEEISHEEIVGALKEGTNHGKIFPVVCGCATRNLGTSRLLDAIVEDLPSPVKHGPCRWARSSCAPTRTASCSRTCSRPAPTRSPGASTCCASTRACSTPTARCSTRTPTCKERIGQLLLFAGKEVRHVAGVRPRRHRRGREAQGDTRRRLAGRPRRADRDAATEAARAGDGVRGRAQEPRRRGQGARRR